MRLFYQFLIEHGPNVVNRDVVFLDFMHKTISEGALIFLKNLSNENEIQKNISNEFKGKYEKENKELKDELSREKQQSSSKVNALEKLKADIEIREEELKKSLKELKENKEKTENDLKSKLNDEQKKLQQQITDLKAKLSATEDELNNSKKNSMVRDSDQEKKNALLNQKIDHLEKSLSDASAREKDWESKYNSLKADTASQIKEATARYEAQNKNLNYTVNELNEKILDYETRVSSESQNWVKEKENYIKKEENFKKSIQEANQTIDTLMKQITEFNTTEREKHIKIKKEYEETIETLTRKLEGFESNLKEKDDSVRLIFFLEKEFIKSSKPTDRIWRRIKPFYNKS